MLRGSPKMLMRMFSAKGNPQAKNLFEIIAYLSEKKEMPWSIPQSGLQTE